MIAKESILLKIKRLVEEQEPEATLILYGSFARGDNNADSDLDLLILLDKDNLTINDENRIKYPLFDLEFDTGQIISPLVFSKKDWESRHKITPFYENVEREGIVL